MLKNHAVSSTLPVYADLRYWRVLVLSGCLFNSELGAGGAEAGGFRDRKRAGDLHLECAVAKERSPWSETLNSYWLLASVLPGVGRSVSQFRDSHWICNRWRQRGGAAACFGPPLYTPLGWLNRGCVCRSLYSLASWTRDRTVRRHRPRILPGGRQPWAGRAAGSRRSTLGSDPAPFVVAGEGARVGRA